MLKFGSNDKVENLGILEKEEAKAYADFLYEERDRHAEELGNLNENVEECQGFARYNQRMYFNTLVEFYLSAIRRHQSDIEDIDALVATIKHRYGI